MDRTGKIKIALLVVLVAMAVRGVLFLFFQTPIDFAPYDPHSVSEDTGIPQEATFTEITYLFCVQPDRGDPRFYHLIKLTDQTSGILVTEKKYINETFDEPLTVTGKTARLSPLPEDNPAEEEWILSTVTADSDYLLKFGLSKVDLYTLAQGYTLLDLSFTDTTTEHPASLYVSILAAVAFCAMLAMLLKERAGTRRAMREKS